MRMTQVSVANLKVCDRITIEVTLCPGDYLVRLWRGENAAYIQGGGDSIMIYHTVYNAVRACKRHSSIKPELVDCVK